MIKLEWKKQNGIYRADNGTTVQKDSNSGLWIVETVDGAREWTDTLKYAKSIAERKANEEPETCHERMQHYLYD